MILLSTLTDPGEVDYDTAGMVVLASSSLAHIPLPVTLSATEYAVVTRETS